MRLLDRYIVRSFLFNYLLAFAVMVGMYTLLDLIVNISRFSGAAEKDVQGSVHFFSLMADIADYYGYQMLVIFQQVSAAIPLLAAGFTMVRMTRHNEMTAMLASGVSLYRVALPIVLCSMGFSLLVIADQEILMPRFKEKLMRQHDEVNVKSTGKEPLYFLRDSGDGSLLMATSYDPLAKKMTDVRIIMRDKEGSPIGRVMARAAEWHADEEVGPGVKGKWKLLDVRQIDDKTEGDPTQNVAEGVPAMWYNTALTPDQLDLVFSKKAVEFLSSGQIQKPHPIQPRNHQNGPRKSHALALHPTHHESGLAPHRHPVPADPRTQTHDQKHGLLHRHHRHGLRRHLRLLPNGRNRRPRHRRCLAPRPALRPPRRRHARYHQNLSDSHIAPKTPIVAIDVQYLICICSVIRITLDFRAGPCRRKQF